MAGIDKDLRGYLKRTEAAGALLTIERAVDPYTEAPALLRQSVKRGKALMFHNVTGSALPVLGNSLASRQCLETALGCDGEGVIDWLGQRLGGSVAPSIVPSGPVKEVIVKWIP